MRGSAALRRYSGSSPGSAVTRDGYGTGSVDFAVETLRETPRVCCARACTVRRQSRGPRASKRSTAQQPAAAATEKRIAVVIGNARYPAIPLNNPENDARVVAATLRKLGFEVSEHVNLPVKKFRQVLRDYVRRLQNESGIGLLYYAGHGVQIDGRNYLLPVDINLRDEEEIKDEAVDIDDLFMSKLARAKTRGLIIILDACRDNPFRNKTRNIQATGGLAEMGVAGAFIGYSAAPGATAEDGPADTNSVFTRHLVKEMIAPGVEIEATFKNVRLRVLEETRRRQMPWSNTSLTIDFHFNPLVADARTDAAKQADLARLQAMLDRRESEQRRLEEELEARAPRIASPAAGRAHLAGGPGAEHGERACERKSPARRGCRPGGRAARDAERGPPLGRQFDPPRVEPSLPPRIEPVAVANRAGIAGARRECAPRAPRRHRRRAAMRRQARAGACSPIRR